jgi:hypothetical protein
MPEKTFTPATPEKTDWLVDAKQKTFAKWNDGDNTFLITGEPHVEPSRYPDRSTGKSEQLVIPCADGKRTLRSNQVLKQLLTLHEKYGKLAGLWVCIHRVSNPNPFETKYYIRYAGKDQPKPKDLAPLPK